MARRPATPSTPPPIVQTRESLRQGIDRLTRVLERVRTFDVSTLSNDNLGPLQALTAEIGRAVERTFGEGTSDAQRFGRATSISAYHELRLGGGPTPASTIQANVRSDIRTSVSLLEQAIASLEGDLQEMGEETPVATPPAAPTAREFSNKVFIVHGRAEAPKLAVARFIEGLNIEAIILHEQPSRSRSVIEKIEAYGDVDFAVVIMTPDDVGGLAQGDASSPRPRQNVLFELGYFIGKLGRANVCVLREGEMEMLSDYVGPIWVDFDGAGAWKQALANELDAAGFNIDWNLVMRRGR